MKKTEETGSWKKRICRSFWYWDSLLAGLAGNYEAFRGDSAPSAERVFSSLLPRVRRTTEWLRRDLSRGGWEEEIMSAFRHSEREKLRAFARTYSGSASDFRRERREFLEEIRKFLYEKDLESLYLLEVLSNETESEALKALKEKVTSLEQDRRERLSFKTEDEDTPEDLPEEEEQEEEAPPEWMDYALYQLTVQTLLEALEIEKVLREIPKDSELLRMIQNTMEEYRSIRYTAERTMDIYELSYSDQTGRLLTENEYRVLLAHILLDGNDNLYGSYYDAMEGFRAPLLACLCLKGGDPEEFEDRMTEKLLENQAALDLSHPRAHVFFLRAILKSTSRRLSEEELLDRILGEKEYADELAERLRCSRLDTERARFIEGDFSGEHLYNQNELAFSQLKSGIEFEQYLKYIFTRLGYESSLTKASGDQGADLICRKNGMVYVIQAKFYDHPVGNRAVQEAAAALKYYDGNRALVVTNNKFTSSAQALAQKNGVMLVDGAKLEELVKAAFSGRAGEVSL